MNKLHFVISDSITDSVNPIVKETCISLSRNLPNADVQHIGSTSIPGALTKGDIDIVVRVTGTKFQGARNSLARKYTSAQMHSWTSTFASFCDNYTYKHPLGIQLVTIDGQEDYFILHRDTFVSSPDLLNQYNQLKLKYEGQDAESYWQAKDVFLDSLFK